MPRNTFSVLHAIVFCVLATVVFSNEKTDLEHARTFPNAERERLILSRDFDAPESMPDVLSKGFLIEKGGGRGGSDALLYERHNPDDYSVCPILLSGVEPGVEYEVSVWVRAEGFGPEETQTGSGIVCVEYKKDGRWAGGTYCTPTIHGPDWQRVSMKFSPKADVVAEVKLFLHKNIAGKIRFDDLEIRAARKRPVIVMTRPDRLSFVGDDDRVAFRIENVPKDSRLRLTILNDGKRRQRLLTAEGQNTNKEPGMEAVLRRNSRTTVDFHARIGKLIPGDVSMTAELLDWAKKTIVFETEFRLRALEETNPPGNSVMIDEHGRTIVDGKPFMPLGVFAFPDENNYRRIAEAGFNCLQLYGSMNLRGKSGTQGDAENVLEGMDAIHRHGLKLIFSLKDQYRYKKGAKEKWGGADGVDAVAEKVVQTVKDHPALLAWYISDEAPLEDLPEILERRRMVSRLDPWHPTWTLTDRYDSDYMPLYGTTGDVIGVDPYPISEVVMQQRIWKIETAMNAAESTGLSCWAVPQIFNWGVYHYKNDPAKFAETHFPTTEEMRAMALDFAMRGARGFVMYSNFDIVRQYDKLLPGSGEREWKKVLPVVSTLKELEPFILGARKPISVSVVSEPAGTIEAGILRDDNDDFRIIIVAREGKARGTLTLPPSLLKSKDRTLRSRFGRTTSLGQGKYECSFDGVDSDILE